MRSSTKPSRFIYLVFTCASNKRSNLTNCKWVDVHWMENTKLPLCKWFAAIWLITAHKKGISSCQLARDLGIGQKAAWFLNHRIREMVTEQAPELLQDIVSIDDR